MLVLIKITSCGIGISFCSRATLRNPRSADRYTDLFGGTEFTATGVLCKTTNVGAPKKQVIQTGAPADG